MAKSMIEVSEELDFTSKLLHPEVKPRVHELLKNGTVDGPLIVEFDPTSVCNFSCPECISIDLLNKGHFSVDRTEDLIEEFHRAGVRGIIFIGGGEPLAHKSMPAPIVQAYELGMAIALTTNGSLIDRYIRPLADCLAWTRVSVDAATQDTFSLFRPSSISRSFSKVIANIELLANCKQGKLGYGFLLIERTQSNGEYVSNCLELFASAKLAKSTGCDYFEFKPMVDEHHNLIPFSSLAKVQILEQFDALDELVDESFRVICPKSFHHLLTSSSPGQPKKYTTCPTIELRTVVAPSGVFPCPYKRGGEGLGDAELAFDEMWNSNERRANARRVNPSRDCQFYCIRHELNELLLRMSDEFEDDVDILQQTLGTQFSDDVFI